jgi:hypothetical protein
VGDSLIGRPRLGGRTSDVVVGCLSLRCLTSALCKVFIL